MPTLPNWLGKAGMNLARAEKRKANISRTNRPAQVIQRTRDTGTSIDSDLITCYKQRMTITHMTLAELANLVDGDELFMELVKEGVITLADDNEKIVITDLTA